MRGRPDVRELPKYVDLNSPSTKHYGRIILAEATFGTRLRSRWRMVGAGEWQALEKRRGQRNVGARRNVRPEKRGGPSEQFYPMGYDSLP